MVDPKHDQPGRGAGWVVAAIVAVVAVCAVTFMVMQRPQGPVAVADRTAASADLRGAQQTPPATPGGAPEAIRVQPLDGADTGRLPPEPAALPPPRGAFDANSAAANASAIEPAH